MSATPVELAGVDQLLDLEQDRGRTDLVGQLRHHDHVVALALDDLGDGPQADRAPAGPVGVQDPLSPHHQGAGREVRALDELHEVVRRRVRVVDEVGGGVDDLAQVVGRDVRGHADGDSLAPVDQQVGEPGGQQRRLLELAGVVVDEVDGVLVDAVEHRHGDLGQTALRVAGRGGRVVGRAEVALGVNQRVAEGEALAHADEGVVDGPVAVGVVLAHDVAGHTGALDGRAVGPGAEVVHAPEDPAVHRLESVPGVGQRPRDDDRHRVVQEGAFHLLLDLDGLELLLEERVVLAVGGWRGGTHMSRNLTSLALV